MRLDLFLLVIESIKEQVFYDENYSRSLSASLQSDVGVYNNSILINSLKGVIVYHFPDSVKSEVLSEIDHYCFYQNFGRVDTGEEILLETTSEFHARLISDFA